MSGPVPLHLRESVRPGRVVKLLDFGLTSSQARFVANVLVFSGVFIERQYRTFTGLVHGQKTHDFLTMLVDRGYATMVTPGALHRGRLFHVQYKPLYEAIEDPDNRHRRAASFGRFVERLMILDAVLADRRHAWLGTERDKVAYFRALLEHELPDENYPQMVFGSGADKTTRYFPDKMPVGIPDGDRRDYVLLYVVTRAIPTDFRAFLLRHVYLLRRLSYWTIRVVIPRRFRKAAALYRAAIRDFLRPLRPREFEQLEWYCSARAGQAATRVGPFGLDLKAAAAQFRGGHFEAVYRAWQHEGESAIWKVRGPHLRDEIARGFGRIEIAELPYQYLQLTPLLESTGVHEAVETRQTTYEPVRWS